MTRPAVTLLAVLLLAACSDDPTSTNGGGPGADPMPSSASSPDSPDASGTPRSSGPAGQPAVDGPGAARSGPVSFSLTASCAKEYSTSTLAEQSFAFDGTITAIGQSVTDRDDAGDLGYSGVTFEVHEWFVGDGPATFTVDLGAPTKSRATETAPSYYVGSRLLVSGQDRWGEGGLTDPIGWGCGFTRYHDEETAAAWRTLG